MDVYRTTMCQRGIFDFIRCNSIATKTLSDEKGFLYTQDMRREKIALLTSEVSELLDAFKKGKGADEEADEIADIAIRLTNIPIMYPGIMDYVSDSNNNYDQIYTYYIDGVCKGDPLGKVKYAMVYEMSKIIDEIDDDLIHLETFEFNKLQSESDEEYSFMPSLIYDIATLILTCKIYSDEILGKNLQDLIDRKMAVNFKRPYRYNTSPKLFV